MPIVTAWETITYLNDIWKEIWIEMRPINPSYVHNNLHKLVSDVCRKLLVVRQKVIIEKLTDFGLIIWWCSYPLLIY